MARKYDSESIVTLEGLDKITQMPSIYVGDLHSHRSLFQMIKEVVDNSNDEAPFGDENFLIKVIFFVDKQKERYQCAVIDNGHGIPVTKVEPAFTIEATSGKYTKGGMGAYKRASGAFGRGAKAVAGLSKIFYAISQHENKSAMLLIKDAKIIESKIYDINNDKGVLVFHEPSNRYFETIEGFIDTGGLKIFNDYIELLAMFEDKTNIVVYKKEGLLPDSFFNKDPMFVWEYFRNFNEGKIIQKTEKMDHFDYLKKKLSLQSDYIFKTYFEYDKDPIGFNIWFGLTEDFEIFGNSKFISAINNVPMDTPDSHHVLTFVNTIREHLSVFSDSIKIQKFIKNNYKLPMVFFINAYWNGATFQNLTKSSFKDSKFSGMYFSCLDQILKQEKYTQEMAELYNLLQDHIQVEYEKYTNKNLINLKGSKNIGSQLSSFDAYSPCRVKDPETSELYIVEGRSAFSVLKQADPGENQALFRAQGKPLNSFKKEKEDVFKNKILRDLTIILGIGPGDPIENINFKKIFIAADPDSNGAHIVDLIIGDLYTINPAIIENGYVNMITSPMYHLMYKQKRTFIKDEETLFEFKVKTIFQHLFEFKIATLNKDGEYTTSNLISDQEVLTFCHVIFKIGRMIETISNRLNIDTMLLEKLISIHRFLEPINEERIGLHLNYDKVIYTKETNTLLLIKDDIEIVILLNSMLLEIKNNILPLYNHYMKHTWEPYVIFKPNPTALTGMISIVELYYYLKSSLKDVRVAKFKGLAGMSPKELGPASLNPATRSYIQITSLGDIQTINDMLGRDSNARKRLL